MKREMTVMAALLALAAPATAQAPAPSPSPAMPQIERIDPPERPVDHTPHPVVVPGPSNLTQSSAGSERLRTWRALSLQDGKGRLSTASGSRDVTPGQVIDGYTVRSVIPGRLVLERAMPAGPNAPAGGTELAIITFDGQRASRVLRIFDVDPTPPPPLPR